MPVTRTPDPLSLPRTAAALALALLVALVLNPDVPLRWAREAPLPPEATLALIRWAEAAEAAAASAGLDRPRVQVQGLVQTLRGD